MLTNFLRIAIRHMIRQKGLSLIAIAGLSIGLTCSILIFSIVTEELSYDKFQSNYDQIYRVKYHVNGLQIGRLPIQVAGEAANKIPEVKAATRLFNRGVSLSVGTENEKKYFAEPNLFFADSSFQEIFDLTILEGSQENLLKDPSNIILTKEAAIRYFGKTDVVGNEVQLDGNTLFKVVAVVEDYPSNSHFHFSALAPYESMFRLEASVNRSQMKEALYNNWVISHSFTYLLLHEGASEENVNKGLANIIETSVPKHMFMNQRWEIEPMSDFRLYSDSQALPEAANDIETVYTYIIIGILTLFIACINFINLSTARAEQRGREIGIRKVMGSQKSSLIFQFLGEAYVVTGVSLGLALIFSFYLLPIVNELTGTHLETGVLFKPISLIFYLIVFAFTGLLAGIYPALFMSRLNPVQSLKGGKSAESNFFIRKFLVGAQFFVGILLLGSTYVIYKQVSFMQNVDPGFTSENIINVPLFSDNLNNIFGGIDEKLRNRLNSFENELVTLPGVNNSTLSSGAIGLNVVFTVVVPEGFKQEDNMLAPTQAVDYDFIELFDLDLIAGRDFNKESGTDHLNAVIINEEAIKEYNFGSPEEAIGKNFIVEGKEGKVIGVVKDIQYTSLSQEQGPFILHISVPKFNNVSIKLQSNELSATISEVEKVWRKHFPEKVFEFVFMDEALRDRYQAQQNLGRTVLNFTFMTLLISCLGSYGLILFVSLRRRKELSIRKVLGANFSQLMRQLTQQFVALILLSMLLAAPVLYFLMDYWLDNYTLVYPFTWRPYILPGLVMLFVVLLTISFQAIKSVTVNPASVLRES